MKRITQTAGRDQLNKYFSITQMPIIPGRYWNMVHGASADDVKQDLEGMQNKRFLAKNFAWHLKCTEVAKKSGIPMPKEEDVVYTNFQLFFLSFLVLHPNMLLQ